MKHSLSNYLDLVFSRAARHPRAAWEPAADVYRCEHGWLIKFDLAGVRPNDITVRAGDSSVTVSGTRRDWRIFDHQEAHLMEIAYSQFERTVELPEQIDTAKIHTEYRDGMLLVHVSAEQCDSHAGEHDR